jgi:hypothetical protein
MRLEVGGYLATIHVCSILTWHSYVTIFTEETLMPWLQSASLPAPTYISSPPIYTHSPEAPSPARRAIGLMVHVLFAPSRAARTFRKCSGNLQTWQGLLASVSTSVVLHLIHDQNSAA